MSAGRFQGMKEARREVLSSDGACHLASPFWLAGSAGATARPAALRLVDIHYRSVNALLVAYAAGLSRGEIFLEAAQELPAGTRTLLRLEVSGTAPLQAEGAVSWTRPVALGPGLPAGAAVALAASMEAQGAVIDQLAARFRRIRMLVISGRTEMRATVCRYLRSILNCDITETAVPSASRVVQVLETELEYGLDLVLADLDDAPQHGRSLLPPLIRALSRVAVPLIAFAEHERDRASAAGWGAKEVLGTPPLFSDVRGAVIHALSSPTSCTIS